MCFAGLLVLHLCDTTVADLTAVIANDVGRLATAADFVREPAPAEIGIVVLTRAAFAELMPFDTLRAYRPVEAAEAAAYRGRG